MSTVEATNMVVINAGNLKVGSDVVATHAFVQEKLQGLNHKTSVRAATTAATGFTFAAGGGTASAPSAGETVFDTVTLADGDRVLFKDETLARNNGIWTVDAGTSGAGVITAFTRATDMDAGNPNEVRGAFCFVLEGATHGTQGFITLDFPAGTGGTVGGTSGDPFTFQLFRSGTPTTGGTGLNLTTGVISVDSDLPNTWTGTHDLQAGLTSTGATALDAAGSTANVAVGSAAHAVNLVGNVDLASSAVNLNTGTSTGTLAIGNAQTVSLQASGTMSVGEGSGAVNLGSDSGGTMTVQGTATRLNYAPSTSNTAVGHSAAASALTLQGLTVNLNNDAAAGTTAIGNPSTAAMTAQGATTVIAGASATNLGNDSDNLTLRGATLGLNNNASGGLTTIGGWGATTNVEAASVTVTSAGGDATLGNAASSLTAKGSTISLGSDANTAAVRFVTSADATDVTMGSTSSTAEHKVETTGTAAFDGETTNVGTSTGTDTLNLGRTAATLAIEAATLEHKASYEARREGSKDRHWTAARTGSNTTTAPTVLSVTVPDLFAVCQYDVRVVGHNDAAENHCVRMLSGLWRRGESTLPDPATLVTASEGTFSMATVATTSESDELKVTCTPPAGTTGTTTWVAHFRLAASHDDYVLVTQAIANAGTTAESSELNAGAASENLFDESESTVWVPNDPTFGTVSQGAESSATGAVSGLTGISDNGEWVTLDLGSKHVISAFDWRCRSSSGRTENPPSDMDVITSTDGTNWTIAENFTGKYDGVGLTHQLSAMYRVFASPLHTRYIGFVVRKIRLTRTDVEACYGSECYLYGLAPSEPAAPVFWIDGSNTSSYTISTGSSVGTLRNLGTAGSVLDAAALNSVEATVGTSTQNGRNVFTFADSGGPTANAAEYRTNGGAVHSSLQVTNFTMVAVFAPITSDETDQSLFMMSNAAGTGQFIGIRLLSGAWKTQIGNFSADIITSPVTNQYYIYLIRGTMSTSATQTFLFQDDLVSHTGAFGDVTANTGVLNIGGYNGTGNFRNADVNFAELRVYDYQLTGDEVADVIAILQKKWNP